MSNAPKYNVRSESGNLIVNEGTDEMRAAMDRIEAHWKKNSEWYARSKELNRRYSHAQSTEEMEAIRDEISSLDADKPEDYYQVWQELEDINAKLQTDQDHDG